MIKSDIDGLEFQQPGILVNTASDEYMSYVQRRNAMNIKDSKMTSLQDQINSLSKQLELLMEERK